LKREKAGEGNKKANRLRTLQALCKMQDEWWLHNSSGNDGSKKKNPKEK
jgi:hypothetical protein